MIELGLLPPRASAVFAHSLEPSIAAFGDTVAVAYINLADSDPATYLLDGVEGKWVAIATTAPAAQAVATRTDPADPPAAPQSTPNAVAPPERCSIRVTDTGITVDGDPMERERAVSVCKQRSTVIVELADNANAAEWNELRSALVAAGVTVLMRGLRGHAECLDNPLAKGCN